MWHALRACCVLERRLERAANTGHARCRIIKQTDPTQTVSGQRGVGVCKCAHIDGAASTHHSLVVQKVSCRTRYTIEWIIKCLDC